MGITDGNTITVLNSKTLKDVKIRLYGIDTPERGQAFSKKAKQFTSKLVYGKVVKVVVMATDRYGRTVAMIYADKTLLNEELIKAVYWSKEYVLSEKNKTLDIELKEKRKLKELRDQINRKRTEIKIMGSVNTYEKKY